MARAAEDSGVHICLRAPDPASVDAFHAAALKEGGVSDGDPGLRPHYHQGYYAAFPAIRTVTASKRSRS
jgi:hypothetical protein